MVDKEILRQIVFGQKEGGFSIEGTVRREILDEILKWFKDNRIIILTGIRRSGKSTLLRQIMHNKTGCCYVNFEDERFIDFKAQDFELLNEVLIDAYNSPKIYFFDEIQNIDKFEIFARRLQDEGKKIILTGSNASLLSAELGTRLTGRYKSFEVYPFSFSEYLSFNRVKLEKEGFYVTEKKVKLIKLFREYLFYGGFPEYLKNKDREYIRTVYENILYRDIIARYSIRRQRVIKELVNILVNNVSCIFTYNSLKKSLGLANSITIKEYISYLSNSYLFFELQRFDFSVRKQLNSPKKIYMVDPAFHYTSGLNFSADRGRMLENLVFIELKRRNKEVYYYSERGECDFLIKEGRRSFRGIQVCYTLDKGNRKREVEGLLEVMDRFGLKEGLILTNEQEEAIGIKGKKIMVVPVWKWLLS